MTAHMIIDVVFPQTRGDERGTSVSNDANVVFAPILFEKVFIVAKNVSYRPRAA
jgi:hypothetical protein